jgi:hypothetical protein
VIHVKAPNGLLLRAKPVPEGSCGVGWTSSPAEARTFEGPASVLLWATEHAPALVEQMGTALKRPAGMPRVWGDLRFSPVEEASS